MSGAKPEKPNKNSEPARPANTKNVSAKENAEGNSEVNARPIESILGGASLSVLLGFCNRMATGLRAGVDLFRILDLESKVGPARHRDVCVDLAAKIRAGYSLSEAMKLQGVYFPTLLVKMIEASEHSGQMDRTFKYMSDYYDDLRSTRRDFQSQIMTPVLQFIAAVLIVCLLIYINGFFKAGGPNEKAIDLSGVGLRGLSGVLIFISIFGGCMTVVGVVAFGIWKNWFNCHRTLVPLVRNVPVIGPVFTMTALSRLSMTLSMMLGAGVDARRSVRDSVLSTGNYYYISGLAQMSDLVQQGRSLAEALDAPRVLPREFIQSVEVGEMSGSDSESLERMAIVYRERAQLALKQLAVVAGFTIWFLIAAMIVTVIFIIFMQYLSIITGNLPK